LIPSVRRGAIGTWVVFVDPQVKCATIEIISTASRYCGTRLTQARKPCYRVTFACLDVSQMDFSFALNIFVVWGHIINDLSSERGHFTALSVQFLYDAELYKRKSCYFGDEILGHFVPPNPLKCES
jgi:hypothetical protein